MVFTQEQTHPFYINITSVIRLVKRNHLNFSSSLKSTSHFLPQSTLCRRSDSSSEANSSCCLRSDVWSHLEYRLVSSAQIAILQITLSDDVGLLLRPVTLLKRRLWHRSFPVNFAKFLRTPFWENASERLLLWLRTCSSYAFNVFVCLFLESS